MKTFERTDISIDDMQAFCKRKGLVYSSSELYGGLAGLFDYGPFGVEMKNNLKQSWWTTFVTSRDDMVGLDGSIISHEDIWKASGHLSSLNDIMLTCSKCGDKVRADQYIEELFPDMVVDGKPVAEINDIVKEKNIKCPSCKGDFKEATKFNLMFPVIVGAGSPDGANVSLRSKKAYLRGETAQLIFTNFRLISENARMKLPCGIAQVGKSFRNEISPRNFLFRCREFEQMEIEYFVHPDKRDECPFVGEVEDISLHILTEDDQNNESDGTTFTISEILEKKIMNPWHAYWFGTIVTWFASNGVNAMNFRMRQHLKKELSHYSTDTWDIEFKFPFGWKELMGVADRGDYDLKSHMKYSKKDLSMYDDATNKKFIPHVIAEPSLGVDRAFLVFMYEAFHDDKERGNIVLHLSPRLAPIKVAIFPLVKKAGLPEIAKKIRAEFGGDGINAIYDQSGSVGKRYARMDEIGTPYCITVDFDTVEKDDTVTLRDRDTTEQKRIKRSEVVDTVTKLIKGKITFNQI